MNKGTKIFVIFYVSIFVFCIFSSVFSSIFSGEEAIANPFDYARITDVDYKAELVDDYYDGGGKVVVTERLTFDIHAASKNNLFWELWRDLPEDYIDGLKVEYKVNSVKQIYDDGTEVVYEESPKLYWDDYDYISSTYGPGKWYHSEGPYDEDIAQYECVFFYVDGLYREKVTFEIEYEMSNAAFRYNDVSELYLTMYSEETIKYLESFKGQILIPNKDMPSEGNYEAYTYGTNSHSFPFTESDTINPGYHTFSFELDEDELKFKPYNQYIEFSLLAYGEDKHIFTDFAPNNYYTYDDVLEELRYEQEKYEAIPLNSKRMKQFVFLLCIAGTVWLMIYTINKDKKMKKKHNFYEPTMKMDYFRDIPSNLDPYFASTLVFSKHKVKKDETNGYSAIMLSLVRKDYIELDRIDYLKGWVSNNIKIIVKYKPIQQTQQILGVPTINSTNAEPTLTQVVDAVYEQQPSLQAQATNIVQPADIVIEQQPNLEPLTPSEEQYFNLIVRHATNNEISMDKFQLKVSIDYQNTNSFVRNIENSIINVGISQGYFQKADYKQPKRDTKATSNAFMVIGILLITLCNIISYHTRLDFAFGGFTILGIGFIISSMYLNKLSKKYVLLTQYGEDEYAKWRGLYNFLNSETLMHERTVIELPIWEQYLVYATAFGISEKVIKALEIRCPNMNMSPMLSNPYYRSSGFRASSRSFRSATRSAYHTSRSGGFGGGGYYGGGGRGGGGGGGGH